ncbi:MAG: G5 domain-containing protein [Firmicutes bacterium]|nr:G5 domain-containing protein [Bacillota bacterium]
MGRHNTGKRVGGLLRALALLLPALLALILVRQTAFAKTYVITDGDRVVTYTTFATDPAEVLDQAGLTLDPNDTYTTQTGEGVEEITICRSQRVTVCYHGEETVVTTFGETVGELLSRLNLEVGEYDVLSHAPETDVEGGMVLRVDSVVKAQESYTSVIPHETVSCHDASIPAGTQEVLTAGVDGEMLLTADVLYVNGVEEERTVINETVTKAPVTEIIAMGTGEAPEAVNPDAMPVIAGGYITLPTGEVLTYTDSATIRATAYTHTDLGCDMTTYTGTTVHKGTVAVDPRYIPYGTRMFIVSNDGEYVYGIAVAEDCGGDIKGDRMDLYFPTFDECIRFGRRVCTVYFLG